MLIWFGYVDDCLWIANNGYDDVISLNNANKHLKFTMTVEKHEV